MNVYVGVASVTVTCVNFSERDVNDDDGLSESKSHQAILTGVPCSQEFAPLPTNTTGS